MQSKEEQIRLSIQRRIRSIDDSLTFVDEYYSFKYRIYQVEKDNIQYTLKIFDPEYGVGGYMPLINESKALEILADVPEYPNLIKKYHNHFDNKIAILKEYCKGESLEQSGKIITYKPLKKRVANAVQIAHERGLARLDLMPRNLILNSNERDAKILDLGAVLFRTENNKYADFAAEKTSDFQVLRDFIFS